MLSNRIDPGCLMEALGFVPGFLSFVFFRADQIFRDKETTRIAETLGLIPLREEVEMCLCEVLTVIGGASTNFLAISRFRLHTQYCFSHVIFSCER